MVRVKMGGRSARAGVRANECVLLCAMSAKALLVCDLLVCYVRLRV